MTRSLILFCLLATLAGCGTTAANVVIVQPSGTPFAVEVNNSSLDDDVKVTNAKALYTGDIMDVMVSLRSETDEEQSLQFMSQWFDKDSFPMEDATQHWQPFILNAREQKNIRRRAPRRGAVKCRFLLRMPLD